MFYSQRTIYLADLHEFSPKLASTAKVGLRIVLRQTIFIAGAGVAIGTLLGVGATILFRSQLYGISPVEWTVLLPVGAAMLALSLLVAYFSARPSISINPMEAIRHA